MNFDNRRCTDLYCLIFFLVTLGAMGFLTFYTVVNGDVAKVIRGMDGAGNFCGVGAFAGYPYVYISNLTPLSVPAIFKTAVCVSSCPEPTTGSQIVNCKPNSNFAPGGTCTNIYNATELPSAQDWTPVY